MSEVSAPKEAPAREPGGIALYMRFNRERSSIIRANAREIGISDTEMINRMVDFWEKKFPRDEAVGALAQMG